MEVIEVHCLGDIEISNDKNQQKTLRIVAERLKSIGDELDKRYSLDGCSTAKRTEIRNFLKELMIVSMKHLTMLVDYLQSLES
jgi:hypothetical protein